MKSYRFVRAAITTSIILTAVAVAAGPQARISGKVVDSSGQGIPHAKIHITSDASPNFKKEIAVKEDGSFKSLILDATQHYVFNVEASGFVGLQKPFKVGVGTTDNEFVFELKSSEENAATQQQELLQKPGYKELVEGRDLLAAGETSAAIAKFEQSVAFEPELIQAWMGLMEAVYKSGDMERALEVAKKCLELDDEATQCLAVAANAAQSLGKTEEQEQYMARYEALNPDDPAAIFNHAVDFLNKMDDDGARPLLEQCLAVDPDFPKCLFEYGMVLLRSGDMEGAKAKLQRYLEVAPEGADAVTAADTVKYL